MRTGIWCGLSRGSGFGRALKVVAAFTDSDSWNAPEHRTTIQLGDIDGNGRLDVCGRRVTGIVPRASVTRERSQKSPPTRSRY